MNDDAHDVIPIKRALVSVSDKTGLQDLARGLQAIDGLDVLSTGGTAKALRAQGLAVRDVGDVTGFPEIMDGRVKTLHPRIHGGLLARRDVAAHARAMAEHDIGAIDLVVVNLYPFEETRASGADDATVIENIDIGGPAMIRAAAKNADFVAVVVSPEDYAEVLEAVREKGGLDRAARKRLAAKAFARTAAYDAAVSAWFAERHSPDATPPYRTFGGRLIQELRYGENPHQRAALYAGGAPRPGVVSARQLQGKSLSFNNLNDADAAFECVAEFDAPTAVIVKHANPCGAASATDQLAAFQRARACDPVSAFGGVIAFNTEVSEETAAAVTELFAEVVIAPAYSQGALTLFGRKKNLRVLQTGGLPDRSAKTANVRSIAGGLLVQDRDDGAVDPKAWRVVTKRAPSDREIADLLFAYRLGKHVKSNAVVYARDEATVAVGAGQMSRVDAARIAHRKALDVAEAEKLDEPRTVGSAASSDAFFPFADGLLAVAAAGAAAVIQPGGSIRDDEVIAAADEKGLAMVFTGVRSFRH